MKCNWASFLVWLLVAICCPLGAAGAATDSTAHRQALLAVRDGRNQKAIQLLTEAIRRDPTDYRLYNDRGVAYKRSGDLDRALSDYTKSLELKPDFTNALNNRGVIYLLRGAPDKAVADLSKALESGGMEQKVQTNLGLALAAKGDYEAAIRSFKKALESGPRDHRVFLFMADSMEKTGAIDKALQLCRLAYGFANNSSDAATIMGRIERLEKQKQMVSSGPKQAEPNLRQAGQSESKKAPAPLARIILRAHPPRQIPGQVPTAPDLKNKKIESLEALESYARASAQAKLSPVAADIFLQGRQFVEKSDMSKALVRFEDTRNLEKRKKNYHAVAWSDLEIGRVLTRMGDHHKATAYFKEALRLFEKLRAPEEWIVACLDLATNQDATGQKEEAAELRTKAVQKAAASGYYDLARTMTGMPRAQQARETKPSAPTAKKATPTSVSAPPHAAKLPALAFRAKKDAPLAAKAPQLEETKRRSTGDELKQLGSIGSGPMKWANAQRSSGKPASQAPGGERQPQGAVFSASGIAPKGVTKARPTLHTEERDLAELKRLKNRQDELGMITVLERMAERFVANKKYEKALQGLDAALGFRDKLQFEKGEAKTYLLRGTANEKLGRVGSAIEDLTHSGALNESGKFSPALKQRCRKLAATLEIDPDAILEAYSKLWHARASRDGYAETRSLHQIAQIYSRAGHKKEALRYYERSLASMLADRARTYEEMGSEELASKAYDEASTAFKELDYSRYIDLERRRKIPNTVSRQ